MISLPQIRIVGLTGMSGAGKSTVSRVFNESGFFVIDCDSAARNCASAGSPFLKELSKNFENLIKSDGTLDRAATAAEIFSDKEKRARYNKIIYPYITYNVIEQIKYAAQKGEKFVLLDAPTLFEARLDGICREIVSVTADEALCEERIMRRDGIDRLQAKARLSAQHCALFYQSRSKYIIDNCDSVKELCEKAFLTAERIRGSL